MKKILLIFLIAVAVIASALFSGQMVTTAFSGVAPTVYLLQRATAPPQSGDGGDQIAFSSDRGGGEEIYLVSADGSDLRQLTNGGGAYPAWSPDGMQIAFGSNRDGNFKIDVMDLDGGEPVRLTDDPGMDLSSDWSPDDAQIAFESDRDGHSEIYVMNADGSGLQQLTDIDADAWNPA